MIMADSDGENSGFEIIDCELKHSEDQDFSLVQHEDDKHSEDQDLSLPVVHDGSYRDSVGQGLFLHVAQDASLLQHSPGGGTEHEPCSSSGYPQPCYDSESEKMNQASNYTNHDRTECSFAVSMATNSKSSHKSNVRLLDDLENYAIYSDSDLESQYSYLDDAKNLPNRTIDLDDFLLLDSDESLSDCEAQYGYQNNDLEQDVISLSSECSGLNIDTHEDFSDSTPGENTLHVHDQLPLESRSVSSAKSQHLNQTETSMIKSPKKKEPKIKNIQTHLEPHKSPSKKQKRKRSKANRLLLMDFFHGQEKMSANSEDITNLCVNALSVPSFVCKDVTSLQDVCIQAVKKYHPRLLTGSPSGLVLPKSLKNIFLNFNLQKSMKRFQIGWLSTVLLLWEKARYSPLENIFESGQYSDLGQIFTPCRNIWNSLPYVADFQVHNQWTYRYDRFSRRYYNPRGSTDTSYLGSRHSAFLPTTCFMEIVEEDVKDTYGEINTDIKKRWLLSAFGTLMDLMMSDLRVRKKDKYMCTLQNEDILRAVKKNTDNLRKVLNTRFPKLTKVLFDRVLPYVYWARGDIKSATDAFTNLTTAKRNDSPSDRGRAMYLCEIGRMHAQTNDVRTATKFYRLAAELMMALDKTQNEGVKGQMMMMTANLYDQGPMTFDKSKTAEKIWETITTMSDILKDGAFVAAAESMLCFHSGSVQDKDGDSWVYQQSQKLTSLANQDPSVNYHLSFVHALCGMKSLSDTCYSNYLKSLKDSEGAPGMEMVKLLLSRKMHHHSVEALDLTIQNPFEPLIDLAVNDTKFKVQPLQVIWRTQFQPFNLTPKRFSYETDICSSDLNLRITSDGYITGDMQMSLPPIRGLYLNQHTGELTFKCVPGDTEPWVSITNCDGKLDEEFFNIPTMAEVYRDPQTGTTVHLNMPNMSRLKTNCYYSQCKLAEQNTCVCHLHWTGPNGERAKISLTNKMKRYYYEKVKNEINQSEFCPEKKEELYSLLDVCYSKGYHMSFQPLTFIINAKEKDKMKLKTGSRKKTKINYFARYVVAIFRFKLAQPPTSFGKCLLLHIQVEAGGGQFYVFINCSSRNTFVEPKIHAFQPVIGQVGETLKNGRLHEAEIYCEKDKGKNIHVFNQEGDLIDEFHARRRQSDINHYPRAVIGTKIIFIDSEKRIWWRENGDFYEPNDLLEVEDICGIFGHILILKNGYGLRFASVLTEEIKLMKIAVPKDIQPTLKFMVSQNKEQLNGHFQYLKLLKIDCVSRNGIKYLRSAMAIDNYLVIFSVQDNNGIDQEITVTLFLELPGYATSVYFLEDNVGFLCTWTQHDMSCHNYREHMFQYDYKGRLLGVLPFLGKGTKSYCPVYLQDNEGINSKFPELGRQGWHVVMKDGHTGIMAVRLFNAV